MLSKKSPLKKKGKKIHRNSTNLVQISRRSKSNVIERQTQAKQHVNDGGGEGKSGAKEKHRFSETRTFLATTAFERSIRVSIRFEKRCKKRGKRNKSRDRNALEDDSLSQLKLTSCYIRDFPSTPPLLDSRHG